MKTKLASLIGLTLACGTVTAGTCPLDGMVSYWRFDETAGNIALDSADGNDGYVFYADRVSNGRVNRALEFGGPSSDDLVDTGVFDVPGDQLTLMAWVNSGTFQPPENTNDQRIISKATGSAEQDHYWMLSERQGQLRFRLKTGGTTTTLIGGNLSNDTWLHVAATYDGSDMRLYIDGVEVASTPKSGDITPADVNNLIGSNPPIVGGDNNFDGRIDEVAIFGRALSVGEIYDLMLRGSYCDEAVPVDPAAAAGSALVFPYYTANEGWSTLFNLTNVTDDFLAVKVRFREMENSRDVLDFNLVMSPKDVWTGWVDDGPNGPRFKTRDSSCTSPVLPVGSDDAAYADLQDAAYAGSSNDSGSTGIERAAEGHVEVFVMGWLPKSQSSSSSTPTAYYADHDHLDCSIVDKGFLPGSDAVEPSQQNNATNTMQYRLAGDPNAWGHFMEIPAKMDDRDYAPLKGNVSFINTGRGVGAGSTALHIPGFGAGQKLVTAQKYPWFLEPTLASHRGLWRWNFADFHWDRVYNEWSVNEKTGASTDWIVSFPDKYLHVDIFDDLQAGVNLVRLADAFGDGACVSVGSKYSCNGSAEADTLAGALANDEAANGSLSSILEPFSEPFAGGQSCDEVTFDIYDREENGVRGSGTSISPAPPVPSSALCYETNVITFGGAPSVLDSRLALTIDTTKLTSGASAGWMDIRFNGRNSNGGLPVFGFAMKERDFGDPNKNYGQLMNHGFGEEEVQR